MAEKIIIKGARIVDPRSSLNGQTVDFLFDNNHIAFCSADQDTKGYTVIEADNLHVSPGWFDMGPEFSDPGLEHKEDLDTGMDAALHGGFTSVAVGPNTIPVVDSKTGVDYLINFQDQHWLELFPLASFSKGLKGEELAELYDLYESGAAGFSHSDVPLSNAALLKLALQYNRPLGVPIQVPAYEAQLSSTGQMHEGDVSTLIGLKGIPDISETLAIDRDIQLADYAETMIHFNSLSSAAGVSKIRAAKANDSNVSADVSIANLYFTDEDLQTYDTRLKTMPPIRSKTDQEALIKGLADGIISFVRSQHRPHEIELKKCEFDYAEPGAVGLEATFGALNYATHKQLSLERRIELLAYGPRELLGLEIPHIEEGNEAILTFFDPDVEWTFEADHIRSKSKNCPYVNKPLKGKALGVFCNGTLAWNED
jgi:dihydroorotase